MGVDIHVFVLKRNKETEKWDKLSLYFEDDGELKETQPLDGWRNREMFQIIQEDLPSSAIKWDLIGEGKEKIEQYKNYSGFYHFSEINYMKLENYLKKHSKVIDDDAEDEYYTRHGKSSKKPLLKKNPVWHLYKQVKWFITFAEGWHLQSDEDDYKIIYFFDH